MGYDIKDPFSIYQSNILIFSKIFDNMEAVINAETGRKTHKNSVF